jgi:6-pyruvoyltetrahydropterin/6-carboxytetrahydropterin synthase
VKQKLYYVATVPFEAARHVDILPEGHRSRRLHGHSFLLRARASLPEGWGPFPGSEPKKLTEALAKCVAPLDYNTLNDLLKVPTDENLARWVRHNLDVPGIETIGIQSTRDEGADLDKDDHAHIWRRFRFEAAHQLPKVRQGHKCGRMHGHGFEVVLHADQALGRGHMGVDFDHLENCWRPLHAELDCGCLNELPGLQNPTSELLAAWIWNRIQPKIPELSWVTIYETSTAGCHYDGTNYRIWKEQSFESALRFKRAPEGHPSQRLHGHSYIIRLHLSAPLDRVLGWTIDYGDVKEIFGPTYKQLDHHQLNDIPNLIDTDVASMANWVKEQMQMPLSQLDRIDVYDTPSCGAILSWGEQSPALPN